MKTLLTGASALVVAFTATPALAITVDGTRDAAYGAATATVLTANAAPTSNFQTPTNTATVGYDVYLTSQDGKYYGFLQFDAAAKSQVLGFANLYFDLNPTVDDGSDLGFELGQNSGTAFIPGKNDQPGFNTALSASDYSFVFTGNAIEFSLSNTLLSQAIPTLAYYPGQTFEPTVTLRLSQSGSYSVAGGDTYGVDRLGAVTLAGAVPEPATWGMMIAGFGLAGGALRSRRKASVAFA